MKKQFVTREIALALKELGFDEPCLARFTAQEDLVIKGCYENSDPIMISVYNSDIHESNVAAPLWQQVIDWFREMKGVEISIAYFRKEFEISTGCLSSCAAVFNTRKVLEDESDDYWDANGGVTFGSESYYEAREAAILEAIKIVKGE